MELHNTFEKLAESASWSESSISSKVFAPGRIEVLGKHTDYAGGDSVTCAVHLGMYFIAKYSSQNRIRVFSNTFNEAVSFDLEGRKLSGSSHWMIYPEVVVNRIVSDFGPFIRGLDICFSADLPHAAGMSSSSALVTGLFLVFDHSYRLSQTQIYNDNIPDRLHLGEYLGAVENGLNYANFPERRGVGTFGGSEDHVAILCSKKNMIGHYSYLPTKAHAYVKLGDNLVFVVAHSGVFAEKSGNALELYNRASTLAEEIRRLILDSYSELDQETLGQLMRNGKADLEDVFRIIRAKRSLHDANDLCDRYAQFHLENTVIIPSFIEALEKGNFSELGKCVDQSQLFATSLLKNQVDETVYLTQLARNSGAIASSAFGGGFGGSVWSLVESDNAESFIQELRGKYLERFPQREDDSKFFKARAEEGARVSD